MSDVVIREATADDCDEIVKLIKELAAFAHLENKVEITAEQLRRDGFGSGNYFRCVVAQKQNGAENSGRQLLVGYGVFRKCYEPFYGRCVYVEDLFVVPEYRNRGIASSIIKQIASRALKDGCARMDLCALKWNERAINFYRKFGFHDVTEGEQWLVYRWPEEAFKRLAESQQESQ